MQLETGVGFVVVSSVVTVGAAESGSGGKEGYRRRDETFLVVGVVLGGCMLVAAFCGMGALVWLYRRRRKGGVVVGQEIEMSGRQT